MKTKHKYKYSLLLFLITCNTFYAQQEAISFLEPIALHKKSAYSQSQQESIAKISEKALQSELKTINSNALNDENLSITLFGKNYVFAKKGTVKGSMGALWHGETKSNGKWGMIWLSYNSQSNLKELIGKIQIENTFYKIQLLASKNEVIVLEEEPIKKIDCGQELLKQGLISTIKNNKLKIDATVQKMIGRAAQNNQACDPRILVMYTPAAAANFTSSNPIGYSIKSAIDYTNTILQNSLINYQLELVGIRRYPFDESSLTGQFDSQDSISDLLSTLNNDSAGYTNYIATQRDHYDADLVMIISDDFINENTSGAATQSIDGTFDAEKNFLSVVRHSSIGSSTIPHEIGHLFGAEHEFGNSSGVPFLPYAHAYRFFEENVTIGFSTNYSAATNSYFTKYPYYSNPNAKVDIGGNLYPVGSTNADNALAFKQSIPRYISRFREPHNNKTLDIGDLTFPMNFNGNDYEIKDGDYSLFTAINTLTLSNTSNSKRKIKIRKGGTLELRAKTIIIESGVKIKRPLIFGRNSAIFIKSEGAQISACNTTPLSRKKNVLNTSSSNLNNSKQEQIQLYPNPTEGTTALSFSNAFIEKYKSEKITINIYNALGVSVKQYKPISITDTNTIDLGGYPSGIYFVKCSVGGKVFSKKLIKK